MPLRFFVKKKNTDSKGSFKLNCKQYGRSPGEEIELVVTGARDTGSFCRVSCVAESPCDSR